MPVRCLPRFEPDQVPLMLSAPLLAIKATNTSPHFASKAFSAIARVAATPAQQAVHPFSKSEGGQPMPPSCCGCAASGASWVYPDGAIQWDFTDVGSLVPATVCDWEGVQCCKMNKPLYAARAEPDPMASGAVSWVSTAWIDPEARQQVRTAPCHAAPQHQLFLNACVAWLCCMLCACAPGVRRWRCSHAALACATVARAATQGRHRRRAARALQYLACPYDNAVTGLRLGGLHLNGTLPAAISTLPLTFLNVSHNPRLHGAIPRDLSTPSLTSVDIFNTSLNCHGDRLSPARALAFFHRLSLFTRTELDDQRWSPGEEACVAVALQHDGMAGTLRVRSRVRRRRRR